MNIDLFYELSRQLNLSSLPDKYSYHIVRYKHFVDGSRKRHNCVYAKRTVEMFLSTNEYERLLPLLDEKTLELLNKAIK
jgi:hypothetical protein